MRIFELFGTVGLEGVQNVINGIENIGKKAEVIGKKLEDFGKGLSKSITAPLVAVGTIAVANATRMGEYADSIYDLQDATGMSTKSIQEWQAVSRDSGTSMEVMTNASKKLTKAFSIGEDGSTRLALGLSRLGLSMEDVKKMSPDERMEVLVGKLQGVESATDRAIIGQQIFGSEFNELSGIVSMSAEEMEKVKKKANELGTVLGEDALEQADAFRNNLAKLKEMFMGLFNTLGSAVIPILNDVFVPLITNTVVPLVKTFADWIQNLTDKFNNFSPEVQETILKTVTFLALLGPMIMGIGKAITIIGTMITAIKAWNTASLLVMGKNVAIVAGIAGLIAIGTALWKSWDGLSKAVKKIWELMGLQIDKLHLNTKIAFKKMEVAVLDFVDGTVKKLKIFEKLPFGMGDAFKEMGSAITENSNKAKVELSGMNRELGKLNKEIAGTKLDALGDALDGLEEGNKVFIKINTLAEDTFSAFKDAGNEIKDSFTVNTEGANVSAGELKKTVEELTDAVSNESTATKGATEEKKEKTEASEKEKEAAEREKKALDSLIESYEKESEINSISIEKMKSRQEQIDKELQDLDKTDKAKQEQIKLLEDEKKALDKTIISLENKKTANDTVINSLKDGINPLELTISDLEKQKKAIDDGLKSLEKQGISTGKNVENLKTERDNLEKNIKSIKSKEKITKDLAKQIANGTITQEQAIQLLEKEKISIEEVTNAVNQYKEDVKDIPQPKLTWQSQLENFWNKFLNSGSKVGNFLKSFQDKYKQTIASIQKYSEKNPLVLKIAKISASSLGSVAKEIGDTMQKIMDTLLGKMDFGNVFQSLFNGDIGGIFTNLFSGIISASEEQTKTQLEDIETQRQAELAKVDESNTTEIAAINAKYDSLKAQAENSGFTGLMKRFNDSFGKVITKLLPIFDKLFIALDPMIELMTQILEILAIMLIEILKPMTPLLIQLMKVAAELLTALSPLIPPLAELASVIISLIVSVIRPFIPIIRVVAEVMGKLFEAISPILEPLGDLLEVLTPIIEPLGKLAGLFTSLMKPIEWIVDIISKVMGAGGNLLGGVADGIGGLLGGIVDGVTGVVGGIVDGIGGLFGFANGGLVTGPTKALIGEAGYPEAVIPLKSDVLSYLGSQIAMATPSNGNLSTNSMFSDYEASSGSGGDVIINLNGDNLVIDDISLQRFARQIFPKIEAERKRRGE